MIKVGTQNPRSNPGSDGFDREIVTSSLTGWWQDILSSAWVLAVPFNQGHLRQDGMSLLLLWFPPGFCLRIQAEKAVLALRAWQRLSNTLSSLHSGSTSLSALKIGRSQASLKLWPVWRREMSHLELSGWLVLLHRGKMNDTGWRAWGTKTGQQSVVRWDQSRWTEHSTACWSWENKAKWPWGTSQHHEKCDHSSLTFSKYILPFLSFGTLSFPFPGILVCNC